VSRSWRWANDCPKHVELIQRSIKLLLLHLIGHLYYSPIRTMGFNNVQKLKLTFFSLMMHGQTQIKSNPYFILSTDLYTFWRTAMRLSFILCLARATFCVEATHQILNLVRTKVNLYISFVWHIWGAIISAFSFRSAMKTYRRNFRTFLIDTTINREVFISLAFYLNRLIGCLCMSSTWPRPLQVYLRRKNKKKILLFYNS